MLAAAAAFLHHKQSGGRLLYLQQTTADGYAAAGGAAAKDLSSVLPRSSAVGGRGGVDCCILPCFLRALSGDLMWQHVRALLRSALFTFQVFARLLLSES